MDNLASIISIISGAISIIVIIVNWLKPFWHNTRYRIRIFVSASTVLMISTLQALKVPLICIAMGGSTVLLSNIILWRSVNTPSFFAKLKLKQIAKWQKKKLEKMDDLALFPQRPWYFICISEKFAWDMQKIEWHNSFERFFAAYVIADAVHEDKLTTQEKTQLNYKKIFILYQLGANAQAKAILEQTEKSNTYRYHMLASLICEQAGDLHAASQEMATVIDCAEKKDKTFLIEAYNNYGRIRNLMGNHSDAYYYYCKAANALKHSANRDMPIHDCWQNLIFTALWTQETPEKLNGYIEDYKRRLNPGSIKDLLEYDNFFVTYMRQTGQIGNFNDIAIKTYLKLKENAAHKQARVLLATSIQQVINERSNPMFFLEELEGCIDGFLKSDIREKLQLAPILWRLLKEVSISIRTRFANTIFHPVSHYIKTQYIRDADAYIGTLNRLQIKERVFVMSKKAGIMKDIEYPYPRKKILDILQDIIELYSYSGLYAEYIKAILDFIDECTFFENHDDLQEPSCADAMRKRLDEAKTAVPKLLLHPVLAEFFLRIAYYEMYLSNRAEAISYLQKFEDMDLSVNLYADWMRGYHALLIEYKQEKFDSVQDLLREATSKNIKPVNWAETKSSS